MIQITFQPALDPFHAAFRILRLRPIIAAFGPLHQDQVRILDFYLTFPFRIEGIRLIPKHRKYRKLASEYRSAKSYGNQPEDQIIFNRMEPIQIAAFETLATHNLITPSHLIAHEIQATSAPVPEELVTRVDAANQRDSELMGFLGVLASEYELTGTDGLKNRTNLMEYRYDAV